MAFLKSIISGLISFLMLFSPTAPTSFGLPIKSTGDQVDLSKFVYVWGDEFEGTSIDSSKWMTEWWITTRKGGYWHEDMARVENGNLIISAKYLETPPENRYYDAYKDKIDFQEYKPGYYSTVLISRGLYEQKYGYFEIRCKLPAAGGLWSAFWLMADGAHNVDGTGNDGAEIDIMESFYYENHWYGKDCIESNVHWDGYKSGEHKSSRIGRFFIENDPYEEYNTYGLEWNENEYIFYINGYEVGRTDIDEVSDVPEYLILSLEISGKNGEAYETGHGAIEDYLGKDKTAEYVVDYVRCYQYKDIIKKEIGPAIKKEIISERKQIK